MENIMRVKLKIKVLGTFETGISVADESGKVYNWHTKSYGSPLFYAGYNEWFDISATAFTYNHATVPLNGLKNVRVLKKGKGA